VEEELLFGDAFGDCLGLAFGGCLGLAFGGCLRLAFEGCLGLALGDAFGLAARAFFLSELLVAFAFGDALAFATTLELRAGLFFFGELLAFGAAGGAFFAAASAACDSLRFLGAISRLYVVAKRFSNCYTMPKPANKLLSEVAIIEETRILVPNYIRNFSKIIPPCWKIFEKKHRLEKPIQIAI